MAAIAFMQVPLARKERVYRNKEGLSLNFTDSELRARYRFGRDGILFLTNLLRDDLSRKTKRSHALTVEQQVLVALRFFASGSFLQVIGDTLGLDKGTVSRVVTSVAEALCDKSDQFIKWPCTDRTKRKCKSEFYDVAGFPNVLGAIDGTHVRIQAPHEDEASYVNRKGYHSINVQAVCDAEGYFTNINAKWPGSCHDAHLFRISELCAALEDNGGWENGILLGDSGYPCRPFLMTPYLSHDQPHKSRYNKCHAITRCVIEKAFGRWKRRFNVLHSEIRMAPEKVCLIVMACAVLHNISLLLCEPDVDGDLQVQYVR